MNHSDPTPRTELKDIGISAAAEESSLISEIKSRLEPHWETWASTTHTWTELAGVRIGPGEDDHSVCHNMSLALQATRDWALHHLASESAEEPPNPASSDYSDRTDNPLIPALCKVAQIAEILLMLIMVPSDQGGVILCEEVPEKARDLFADFATAHRNALLLMRRQLDTAIRQNAHMLEVLEVDEILSFEDFED